MYNAKRHVTSRQNRDGTARLYFFKRGMPIVRLPDPSSPLFEEAYEKMLAESQGVSIADKDRAQDGYRRQWADYLWERARYRPNRQCALTADDVLVMFRAQQDRCALSGLRFHYRRLDEKRDPMSPSLDRIDSRGEYTIDNCRVVLLAVNVALNSWGDEVFLRICKAVADRPAPRISGGSR